MYVMNKKMLNNATVLVNPICMRDAKTNTCMFVTIEHTIYIPNCLIIGEHTKAHLCYLYRHLKSCIHERGQNSTKQRRPYIQ